MNNKRRKYKEVEKRPVLITLPVSLHALIKEKDVNFSRLVEQCLHEWLLKDVQTEFLDKDNEHG